MALSRLFQALYGVSLRVAEVSPGEAWHADVRKLEVMDERMGVLGWIYADLYARGGKPGGAAHYTVRCSRRTDDDDEQGDLKYASQDDQAIVQVAREFETSKHSPLLGQNTVYQLPVVVLLCEFVPPSIGRGPSILEWHEVLTLFHEMGHAMHCEPFFYLVSQVTERLTAMIGRTEYQNVSGTRCATDFVELPSILMEHFLNSPTVLSLFDPTSPPAIRQVGSVHEDPCRSIDTHTQILLAMLDQIYHSSSVLPPTFDSTVALMQLYAHYGLIPYVPGTSWQTQFGHLFGYGATYYSYLFDRAIASRVWRELFSCDPLNRKVGEKLRGEVLRHGGGKDPWKMVSSLLNSPELEVGDAAAMAEVGRWNFEDEIAMPGRH